MCVCVSDFQRLESGTPVQQSQPFDRDYFHDNEKFVILWNLEFFENRVR